jgi:hypothetical protein
MATSTEPLLTSADERTDRRLRTAGVVAIAAAALGSVLVTSPAVPEAPSTDCRIQISGDRWYGSGCEPVAR